MLDEITNIFSNWRTVFNCFFSFTTFEKLKESKAKLNMLKFDKTFL